MKRPDRYRQPTDHPDQPGPARRPPAPAMTVNVSTPDDLDPADITAGSMAEAAGARAEVATISCVGPGCGHDTAPDGVLDDALGDAMDRHPSAVGRHLDAYLAAVARELRARGVLTGSPQRTDPAQRLLGSIVLDCTAVRVAAWADDPSAGRQSLGGALHPERPAPVVLTWDEETGWCAGLHHDPTSASRRYLPSERLPTPDAVAEFVIGLALGRPLGAAHPPRTGPVAGRPRLRLLR